MPENPTSTRRDTLAAPRPSNSVLARPRLAVVGDSTPRPDVVAIWATAGAGKTTLLTAWADELRALGEYVAWITLSAAHADDEELDVLVERAMNGCPAPQETRTIFIDDAHLASGTRNRQWLSRLARDPRPGLTIIIAGRYQPVVMPGTRYGTRYVELRSGDLAFTEEEAAAYFLARAVELSRSQLRAILARTDGWAVALALMADRLDGTDNADALIRDFSGNHRSVADYLVSEVLAQQPDSRQRFLMQTSVVDELTVPLAVHLTGHDNAGDLLEELADENTLVKRGGGDTPTFHYHAMLRSHLHAQLMRRDYGGLVELHASASQWFQTHGRPDLALQHALITDDSCAVGRILAASGTGLVFTGHGSLVHRAIDHVDAARASTPASHLLSALLAAPHFFSAIQTDHHLAVVRERVESLPGHLRTVFAALHLMRAAGTREIEAAQRLLDLSETEMDDAGWEPSVDDAALDAKIFAHGARGLAQLHRGNGAAAASILRSAASSARLNKRPWLALLLLDLAATSAATAGMWAEASAIEVLMASTTEREGHLRDPAVALAHFTIATAAYNRCDEIPLPDLADVIETGERENDAGLVIPGRILGELIAIDGSANPRRHYEELDRLFQGTTAQFPRTLANAAYRYMDITIRFHGKQRGRELARVIAAALGTGSVDYRVAAALLYAGTPQEASAVLELQSALESPARVWCPGNLVLGWLLLSKLAEISGRPAASDERLLRALDLAEQMRARRPFMASAGFGAKMLEPRVGRLGAHEAFAESTLDAFHHIFGAAALSEPDAAALTKREHDILRELPLHQSISEIARKQQLSANTIKTHLRSIYHKLGANGRSEAVQHASHAGLI